MLINWNEKHSFILGIIFIFYSIFVYSKIMVKGLKNFHDILVINIFYFL